MNPECGAMIPGTDKDVKKYCGFCNTAAKREAAHEENEEIKKLTNLKLQTNEG